MGLPKWMETEKENPRGRRLEFLRFPIALHPYETDDSGQVFSMPSNRCGAASGSDFGGYLSSPFGPASEASRNTGSATDGFRTSIKNLFNLPGRLNHCQHGHGARHRFHARAVVTLTPQSKLLRRFLRRFFGGFCA